MRADGESSARLGALSRGYAQLGVLSEFHWHPAHKAFKARALLYAQRSAARDPASPWGLWNRAFVLAMVGLPRDAQADLDEARKRADALTSRPTPPDWVGVTEAYLARDAERLRLEDGPHRNLAALFRMMVFEYPTWTAVALRSAKEVVALEPECYRAHDLMCQIGGVANLHVATELGPETLGRLLPEKLDAVPSLPKGVRQALARCRRAAGLARRPSIAQGDRLAMPASRPGASWRTWSARPGSSRSTAAWISSASGSQFRPTISGSRPGRTSPATATDASSRPSAGSPRDAVRTLAELLRQLDPTDLECTAVPLSSSSYAWTSTRGRGSGCPP